MSKESSRNEIFREAIILIIGACFGGLIKLVFDKFILPSSILALFFILICIAVIGFMVYRLTEYIDELRHNVGIRIRYFDRERYSRETVFEEATKIINQAKQSIFVLNSFLPEKSADVSESRDSYYESLIERAVKGGVVYKRFLQLSDSQTVADVTKDSAYLKHYYRILEEKDKNPRSQLSLKKTPAKRLSTFVLVDNENLIWQINEPLPSGVMQMHGIFIIQDPRGEITQHFRAYIDKAEDDDYGAVKRSELPPLPLSEAPILAETSPAITSPAIIESQKENEPKTREKREDGA